MNAKHEVICRFCQRKLAELPIGDWEYCQDCRRWSRFESELQAHEATVQNDGGSAERL